VFANHPHSFGDSKFQEGKIRIGKEVFFNFNSSLMDEVFAKKIFQEKMREKLQYLRLKKLQSGI
jgi:hypothetical protein